MSIMIGYAPDPVSFSFKYIEASVAPVFYIEKIYI